MTPEVRRSLALGAVAALVLSTLGLWLASRLAPAMPASSSAYPAPSEIIETAYPGPTVAVPTPTPLAVEIKSLPEVAATTVPPTEVAPAPSPTPLTVVAAPAGPAAGAADTTIRLPLVFVPAPTVTPGPVTPPTGSDWRTFLNYYRAVARLSPLAEDAGWSDGAFKHARYLVENDTNTSGEDPALAWYTGEGATAGANSLWQLRGEANWNDVQTFDNWMKWPFHALSIVDPALQRFGYGRYSEPGADPGPFHTGAVLDIRRGQGTPGVAYPVMWPAHNTAVYLTSYDGGEQPDPLTSCSGLGLNGPAGLPILLQLGAGDVVGPNTPRPVVSAHSFKENGVERDHCLFDETSYQNSITALRDEGRAILAARDAIVLIPRAPLIPGKSYTVSITAQGQTHTWTFRVVAKP